MAKLYFGGRYSIIYPGKPALNFGLPPNRESLEAHVAMLAGSAIPWIVELAGDVLLESPLARLALERGGNLRVGIEDAAGLSQATHQEMGETAVRLAAAAGASCRPGRRIASGLGRCRAGHELARHLT
jgi:3-keto-5-aminohexanoate cleavage enzyme